MTENGGITMWFRVRALILLLFIAVCFQKVPAQVTSAGSIAGQVVDASGALLPGVAVIAVQIQTNGQWKSSTGDSGNYIFPNLPVGTFTLSALKGKGYFPMRVVATANGKGTFRLDVTSVEKVRLPDSEFAAPEGWRKLDIGSMMGGAMPGGFPGARPAGNN